MQAEPREPKLGPLYLGVLTFGGMSGSEKNRLCLDHSRCLKRRPSALTRARSLVCQWSKALSMMP